MGETWYILCDSCREYLHLWKLSEIKMNRSQTNILVNFMRNHRRHNLRFVGSYDEIELEGVLNTYKAKTDYYVEYEDDEEG